MILTVRFSRCSFTVWEIASSLTRSAGIAQTTAEEDEEDDEDADAAATADPEADPEAESSVVTDEQPVCSVTIEMVDINFNPNQFTMPADQPVELMFRNDGKLPHDFTQEQLGIDVDVDAGESASGCVVFALPPGVSPAKVKYAPSSGFADDFGEWQLP